MRPFLAVALVASGLFPAGCCWSEPDYRNYGARPHEWSLPGPEDEQKVFGPMPSEEVRDFVRAMESDGWQLIGYREASLPEDVMVHSTELDAPAPAKRQGPWTFDIPKTMDPGMSPPRKRTVPPYVGEDVKAHRQKYLVIMRRWL